MTTTAPTAPKRPTTKKKTPPVSAPKAPAKPKAAPKAKAKVTPKPARKLTDTDVIKIRARYPLMEGSQAARQRALAAEFSVSESTVYYLLRGETHKKLLPPGEQ